MAEKTVTVGDVEVTISETEDGFEVSEAEPEPGSLEHFEEHVISEGDSLSCGSVDTVEEVIGPKIRVHANRCDYDVMETELFPLPEGWQVAKIEFEYGYADFVHEEA